MRSAGGQAEQHPGDHQGGAAEFGGGRGAETEHDRGDDRENLPPVATAAGDHDRILPRW